MTEVQWRSSQLEVQNSDLTSKLQQCEDKYKTAVAKATMDLDEQQKLHDQQVGSGAKLWEKPFSSVTNQSLKLQ